MKTIIFLFCVYAAVGVTTAQGVDGSFLLAGAAENTVFRLENNTFSKINISNDVSTMAFDPISRRIYYGSWNSIHMYSMKLDGSDVRIEATIDLYVQAIAIDNAVGNMFVYSPGNTGKIYRVVMEQEPTLDQSDIIHTDESEVFHMDVDPTTRTLFWGSSTGIWQSNYDGTDKKQILSMSGGNAGLSVDDGSVYGIMNNKIYKIDRSLNQSFSEIFDIGNTSTRTKSLVSVGDSLYFSRAVCTYSPTTLCQSSIVTVRKDGSGFARVSPELFSENHVYPLTLVYVSTSRVEVTTTSRTPTETTTRGVDGSFLLAGAAENTVFRLENNTFSKINISNDVSTMAFDPISRRIYYGSWNSIHMYSMKLDGSDVRIEATIDLYVQAIAIDNAVGNMFVYSPGNTGKIYRVVMGQEPTLDQSDIIHTDESEVFHMDVDPTTRTLFWGSSTGIWQSNYDGTDKKQILSMSGGNAGLSVDDGSVYGIMNNKIYKIDRSLNQSFSEIFDIGNTSTRTKSLVSVGDSLYFSKAVCTYSPTTLCQSSIVTVRKDGSGFARVSPELFSENHVYPLTLVYVSTSRVEVTTTSRTPTETTTRGVDGSFLLAGAAENTVFRLENNTFSKINISNDVSTMAFDPISRRIYYGSWNSIHMYSMKLDGSDVRIEATIDLYVQAIAIDNAVGNMFVYSPGNTGKIYRVVMGQEPTLDQSDIIHTDESEVFHMDVDPTTRTLFWGSSTGIWQSNYDGTDKKQILSMSGGNAGLSVDDGSVYGIMNNKIYKIDRSLNQSFSEIFDIGNTSTRTKSLVSVGDSLYFSRAVCTYSPTTLCQSSIVTVRKDGSGFARVSPELFSENHVYPLTLVYVSTSRVEVTTTSRTPTETTTRGVDGSFLLAGAAENTVFRLENNTFSKINISNDVSTMAFDPISRRIYYGSWNSIHMYSMKLDGSDVRIEATIDLYVQAIAIDNAVGNMFVYSPGNTGKIYRVVMGQEPTLDQSDVIHTDEHEVFHIYVDPTTRTLFWGSSTGIWQSNYDGTDKKQILSMSGGNAGLSVDDGSVYGIMNNKIYKIDRSRNQSFSEIFDIGNTSTRTKSLVSVGDSLYFSKAMCTYTPTTLCQSSIVTVRKDGSGFARVSPELSSENHVYPLTLVYVSTSRVEVTTTSRTPTETTTRGVDGSFLLAGAAENTVFRLENNTFSKINISNDVSTMAFDPISRRIYYGSWNSIHMYSMKLDGSDVRIEATIDLYVQAIAIDNAVGNMFVYSPGNTGKIYRVVMEQEPTLDQSDIIHTDESEVFHMDVDPTTRTLFWGSSTGIWQSNYDGTDKKQILSMSGGNAGLSVDDGSVYGIMNNKIYKIDRSLNQSFSEIFDIGNTSTRTKSLVSVGDSLYFSRAVCTYSPTTLCQGSIVTVRKDGSGFARVSPELFSENHVYPLTLVYVSTSRVEVTTTSRTPTETTTRGMERERMNFTHYFLLHAGVDGSFLLAGAAENTVFRLENNTFSKINISNDVSTMAFDPISRRIYYGSWNSIHMYSMKLDGSDVRIEATIDLYVQAIAIDNAVGNMFVYSPGNTGKIYRVVMEQEPTLDQSDIIHTDESEVFHMDVDPTTRTLFWGSSTGIWQSNYDGTDKKQILSMSGGNAGLSVDDGSVYGIMNNKIYKIDRSLNQSFSEIFDIGNTSTRTKSLVSVGDSLYFSRAVCTYSPTTLCQSSIVTVRKDGSGFARVSPELFSENHVYPLTLVYVSTPRVEVTTTSRTPTETTTRGMERERMNFTHYFLLHAGVDGSFLLAGAAENTVFRLENNTFSKINISNDVSTMAFDPISRRIYYGSWNSIHMYSMKLDGSDVRIEATIDLYVQAIAIDNAVGNMFVYSPGNTGKIYRVVMGQEPTLDQSDIIHTDESEVFHMDVDPTTRTIFWGSITGVWQSNYDGTNKQMLSMSWYNNGLTVADGKIYGIMNNKIVKIDRSLNQSSTEILDIGDSSISIKSLVSVGDSLFFSSAVCVYNPTSLCQSSIATVQKDGTGFTRVSPEVSSENSGYHLTLVYVSTPRVEMRILAIVLLVVCPLVTLGVAAIVFIWWKVSSLRGEAVKNNTMSTYDSPVFVDVNSHTYEELPNKTVNISTIDYETLDLEKKCPEQDMYQQIGDPYDLPKI
ncbi:uncharacterized protein LOC132544069 [Ylistrum balloti]|uniref:uncharacterized protein LOC132544069 n=1 Tax=Ylistrum balloti TaxID=509963 RepID=UPI002905A118|nr:uncharacterized protein LOC132544069 [Ylistrum balloti]